MLYVLNFLISIIISILYGPLHNPINFYFLYLNILTNLTIKL